MPPPLLITWEKVSWRVDAEDLALLRAVYGEGKVNEVARTVIHSLCERLRAQGLPRSTPTH